MFQFIIRKIFVFFLCVLPLVLTAAAHGQTEVETVRRGDADSSVGGLASGFVLPVTKRIEFFGLGAYIRGNQATKIALIDVRFKVNKYLTVTPGYFGLFVPKVNGRRDYDHRARIAATLSFQFGNFKISDRNLLERRFRASNDSTRYRNRFELQQQIKINRREFNLYGNVEPFYDFNAGKITRTHVQIGFRKRFAKRFSADTFYLRQFVRGGADTNALAFGVIVHLPQLFGKK